MVRLNRIGWQPMRGASFLVSQTHFFTSPRQGNPLDRDSLLGMEYMVVVFYFKFMVLAIFSLLSVNYSKPWTLLTHNSRCSYLSSCIVPVAYCRYDFKPGLV